MNDTSTFLTVTSANPDAPVWLGALVTALVVITGISLWIKLGKVQPLSVKVVAVVSLAALAWGAVNWWAAPSTPTVRQAVLLAFSVDLDSDPDNTDVLEGAKLSGRSLSGDAATCFITPSPVASPARTLDLARLTMVSTGTVVATCTSGPPPPDLGTKELKAPPPPAKEDTGFTEMEAPKGSTN